MEKGYIMVQLQELLNRIPDYFEPDELAYYSAHCKNEQQIRDKIAWHLHKEITQNPKYGDKYVVRREWAPEGASKSRVDLAILEMDENKTRVQKVIALIEFKAQSIVKCEKWYLDEFSRDVEKMRGFIGKSPCAEAELYFVFLETGQWCKADKYKSILGYSIYQNGGVKFRKDSDYLYSIKSHWEKFKEIEPGIEIPEPTAIEIGEAYGYRQFVSPLLIKIPFSVGLNDHSINEDGTNREQE